MKRIAARAAWQTHHRSTKARHARNIENSMLLREITFPPASRQPRIRPDDGVIEGVRILGRESKNGRTYSQKAMREAARFYDGCEVNIDHPGDKSRSSAVMERGLAEGFGELRNISIRDDGVYGDLHYLNSHPMAPQVVERAERFPSKVGLSHNAEGQVRTQAGRTVEQNVPQWRIPLSRGVDGNFQPLENRPLANHFAHVLGAQALVVVLRLGFVREDRFSRHRARSTREKLVNGC